MSEEKGRVLSARCLATTYIHRQCERAEVGSSRLCWQHQNWKPYVGWKPGPSEPVYDDRGTD